MKFLEFFQSPPWQDPQTALWLPIGKTFWAVMAVLSAVTALLLARNVYKAVRGGGMNAQRLATEFDPLIRLKRPRVKNAKHLEFVRSLPCLLTGRTAGVADSGIGTEQHP